MGISVEMSFDPDLSKQAQEIVFSCKTHEISHPNVNFNNSPGIDSWVQPRLNLGFSWVLKPR